MKKNSLITGTILIACHKAAACTTCNKELQMQIYDSTFFPNLFIMLSAFIVLGLVVFILSKSALKRHTAILALNPSYEQLNPVPLTTAATVLGIGMGGFIDGIVFHQVLQWHEMLSNKIPVTTVMGKSVNMFWDGIFHLFCLLVVFTGIILLWKLLHRKDIIRSGKLLAGGLILGWGLFNIIEGSIDHHLLKLHNVKEISAHSSLFNLGFLFLSVLMIIIGIMLVYRKDHYKSRAQ